MKIKGITQAIVSCFHEFHIDIELEILSVTEEHLIIFQVIQKPGVQQKSIFSACSDVQCALQIPLFHLYKDGLRILLAVSWKKFKVRSLTTMLKSSNFLECIFPLPIALGYDMLGNMAFDDLSETSCLVVGGAGNSGKSVALKCLIASLIAANTVEQVSLSRLIAAIADWSFSTLSLRSGLLDVFSCIL